MVEATIISKDLDDKGNIRIWTQYKIDGKEVESDYDKIDGKAVYATRFNANNLAGLSDAQIELRILQEAKTHAKNLTRQEFIKNTISTNINIFNNNLKTLVGKKVTVEDTEIKVDDDITLIVKTDGTKTEKVSG